MSTRDVFKPQGLPTVTYVKRGGGKYEKELSETIDTAGTICFLTGPSKTGKTTLYTKVCADKRITPVKIRCHKDLTIVELWKKVYEQLSISLIVSEETGRNTDLGIGGQFEVGAKIPLLGGISVEGSVDTTIGNSRAVQRSKIYSEPSPEGIINELSNLKKILVIEDFHYLSSSTQQILFQQLKVFVDEEVTVILVGVGHHLVDVIYSNNELIGRIKHIKFSPWDLDDLSNIVIQGFDKLRVLIDDELIKMVAKESVGLPIITQSVCLEMLLNFDIRDVNEDNKYFRPTKNNIFKFLNVVATSKYSAFSDIYDRIVRGPRENSRKYNTYEIILLLFASEELLFSLTRENITIKSAIVKRFYYRW